MGYPQKGWGYSPKPVDKWDKYKETGVLEGEKQKNMDYYG